MKRMIGAERRGCVKIGGAQVRRRMTATATAAEATLLTDLVWLAVVAAGRVPSRLAVEIDR